MYKITRKNNQIGDIFIQPGQYTVDELMKEIKSQFRAAGLDMDVFWNPVSKTISWKPKGGINGHSKPTVQTAGVDEGQ